MQTVCFLYMTKRNYFAHNSYCILGNALFKFATTRRRFICCLVSERCDWPAKMTSRWEVVNYSCAGNLHFRRISSLRERKYKRRFQPNVVFYAFYFIFSTSYVQRFSVLKTSSVRIYNATRETRWRNKNRFGKLVGFFNVSLQTPFSIALLNESPRPN